MQPTSSPRGFDEDGSSSRSAPMSGQTLLNWGTCRTEFSMMLVAGIFLVLGLGLALYLESMSANPRGRMNAMNGMDENLGLILAITPAMTLFLTLGSVMVVISFFVGGAPSESGASGWSLGTRVSFLAFLLSIEGWIYLLQTDAEVLRKYAKLFVYLFAGELGLVIVFWSLYQRAVARWVGLPSVGVAVIPFLFLGLGCVALYAINFLETTGLIRDQPLRAVVEDRNSIAMISTISIAALALFQAVLAGVIRSGITNYVLRNMPK